MKSKPANDRVEYWTKIIEAARRHPGGVGRYCNEHKINLYTYYYWFKRLRSQHSEWNSENSTQHQKKQLRAKQKPQEMEVEPKARRRSDRICLRHHSRSISRSCSTQVLSRRCPVEWHQTR